MVFRYYTNAVSQASRAFAAGTFIIGLLLIGFGLLIYLLPKFFATLAAIVFFVAGIGCAATATKIFLVQKRIERMSRGDEDAYRKNVQIHIEDKFDSADN
jgi:cobalamin biosynthesis protein CobD/CbiB